MLVFPQLSTGALVQYPLSKQRLERTIQNISQDGSVISLYDIYAPQIRWSLTYQGITDAEANVLTSFFETCEGSLQPFVFVDPSANLFLFSEDLTRPVWIVSTLVHLQPGAGDPLRGAAATRVINPTGTALPLTQSVATPGQYTCAFSVYLRCSAELCSVSLSRSDGNNVTSQWCSPSAVWTRFSLSSTFASSMSGVCQFSLIIPAGSSVDVFGFQVDAQVLPGTYISTTSANATYPDSRFDMEQMTVVATGPSQNTLHISILSRASS